MPNRHAAADIEMQRIELRRAANFRNFGDGALINRTEEMFVRR